jgi:hypothetical protein
MADNKLTCNHCGARIAGVTHGDYGLGDWGFPVVVMGIELVWCWVCGSQDPVSLDPEELMSAMTEGLASSPAPLSDSEAWVPPKFPARSAG